MAKALSTFYTDIILKDKRASTTDVVSDMALLEPGTRSRVEAIIADAKAHGVALMVFETYRSAARQKLLFDQGATKLKKVGVHHYGLACDIVKSAGGHPSWKGDFSLLGTLAHAHGLIWGGDWGAPGVSHSFIDAVHVQRCTVARQAALFNGIWYPDDAYDPYAEAR
jgi:hypothetical protein